MKHLLLSAVAAFALATTAPAFASVQLHGTAPATFDDDSCAALAKSGRPYTAHYVWMSKQVAKRVCTPAR